MPAKQLRLVNALVLLTVTTEWATAADLPARVENVVCPVVGPFAPTGLPEDVTPEKIVEDFQPEVAEWSVLTSLQSHPLSPKEIRGGIQYDFAWLGQDFNWNPWQKFYGEHWQPAEEYAAALVQRFFGERLSTLFLRDWVPTDCERRASRGTHWARP